MFFVIMCHLFLPCFCQTDLLSSFDLSIYVFKNLPAFCLSTTICGMFDSNILVGIWNQKQTWYVISSFSFFLFVCLILWIPLHFLLILISLVQLVLPGCLTWRWCFDNGRRFRLAVRRFGADLCRWVWSRGLCSAADRCRRRQGGKGWCAFPSLMCSFSSFHALTLSSSIFSCFYIFIDILFLL